MADAPVIAVTGATGYVGGIIADALSSVGRVVTLGRSHAAVPWDLEDASPALADRLNALGATTLVHTAWDMRSSRLADQERSSVAGSRHLLDAAIAAGVRRLVFISTISAFRGARSTYGRTKLAVEKMFLDAGGTVIRPGLVYGPAGSNGGMFGTIRQAVHKGRFVPMIGDGAAPQYMLDASVLADVVRRAAMGDLPVTEAPITLAWPEPVAFRDMIQHIATAENRRATGIPIPWPLLYAGLRCAELVGLKPGVRSDSVISFVHQNPAPDFAAMKANAIHATPPVFDA